MTQWRLRLLTLALTALLSGAAPLMASDKEVTLTLHVVINAPPPCTVTGGEVEFGNVATTSVDGVNNAKKVGYSLYCTGRLSDFLKLQIQGTAVVINGESVLQTDVPGLGIGLQMADDNTLIPPGTTDWLPFQYRDDAAPGIKAILVKENNVTLTGGEFNAVATLVVDYQ